MSTLWKAKHWDEKNMGPGLFQAAKLANPETQPILDILLYEKIYFITV